MNIFERIEHGVVDLLADEKSPIIAKHNFAVRDKSVASGISGLRLALENNLWSVLEPESKRDCLDIFSVEIDNFNPVIFNTDINKTLQHDATPLVGDIFSGTCNLIWTDIVLNRQILHSLNSSPNFENTIVRKGIAHGELIRDFMKWIATSDREIDSFNTSEDLFFTNGWCNGRTGLLVILTLLDTQFHHQSYSNKIIELFDLISHSIFEDSSELQNFGLCHGISGTCVVLAGVARFLGDGERLKAVQSNFEQLITEQLLLETDKGTYVDGSWLTGFSGVLWARKVIEKQPTFNPLLPCDSSEFSEIKCKP